MFEMLNSGGVETCTQAYALVQALCYSITLYDRYVDYVYERYDLDSEDIDIDLYKVLSSIVIKFGLCPRSVGISLTHDNRFRPQWADFANSRFIPIVLDVPRNFDVRYCPGKLSPTIRDKISVSFRLGSRAYEKDRLAGMPPCPGDAMLYQWWQDVINEESPCMCSFDDCADGSSENSRRTEYDIGPVLFKSNPDDLLRLESILDSCLDIVHRREEVCARRYQEMIKLRNVVDVPVCDDDSSEVEVFLTSSDDSDVCFESLGSLFEIDCDVPDLTFCVDGTDDPFYKKGGNKKKTDLNGKKSASKNRRKILNARQARRAAKRKGEVLPVKEEKALPSLAVRSEERIVRDVTHHPVVIPVLGQWNFVYVDTGEGVVLDEYLLLPIGEVSVYVPAIGKFLAYRHYNLTHNLYDKIIDVYLSRTLFHDYETMFLKYLSQYPSNLLFEGLFSRDTGTYAGKCRCDFLHRFCSSDCFYVPEGPVDVFMVEWFSKIDNVGVRRLTDSQMMKLLIIAKTVNVKLCVLFPGIDTDFSVLKDWYSSFYYYLFREEAPSLYWLDMIKEYMLRPVDYSRIFSSWLLVLIFWEFSNSLYYRGVWSYEVFQSFIYQSYVKLNKWYAFRVPYLDVVWMLGGVVV